MYNYVEDFALKLTRILCAASLLLFYNDIELKARITLYSFPNIGTVKLRIEAPASTSTSESDPRPVCGAGIYPGPGLYHNLSSLWYFIQIIVNFHVYRVPVFCLFSH